MDFWRKPPSPSRRRLVPGLALTAVLSLSTVSPATSVPSKKHVFAVVASRSVSVERVSLSDLRLMFKLEKRYWKTGEPLVVLIPAYGSSTRSFVLGRLCHSNEGELRQLILEKMSRGEIDLAPKVVASDAEALSFVAAGRGIVAIVPIELAEDGPVKVLSIDGRRPGSAGYTLAE